MENKEQENKFQRIKEIYHKIKDMDNEFARLIHLQSRLKKEMDELLT